MQVIGLMKNNIVKNLSTEESNGLNINRLFKQIVYYFPGTILPAFLGLLSTAVFTRLFGAIEYGQYSLVLNFSLLLTAILTQWLQQSINRYIPTATEPLARVELKNAIAGSLVLILAATVIVVLVLFLVHDKLLGNKWQPFFLPSMILVLGMSLFYPICIVLQAEMRAKEYAIFNLLNSIFRFVLSLLVVYLISSNVQALLWGAATSVLLLVPFLWHRVQLNLFSLICFKNVKTSWTLIKKFASYGIPLIGYYIAANLLNVGDRYIIQWLRGSREVGIYSASYNLVYGAVSLLSAPVLLAAHPFLMKSWSINDKELTGKWLGTIIEWFLTIGLLIVGAMWLLSRDLAKLLLGEQFYQGYIIIPVIVAGIIVWQIGLYAHKPLEFAKQTKIMMGVCLLSLLLNLILNIILVPSFGYLAAAYTTMISFSFYSIIVAIIGQKTVSWRVHWKRTTVNTLTILLLVILIFWSRLIIESRYGYLPGLFITIVELIILTCIIIWRNGYQIMFKSKFEESIDNNIC